MGNNSQSKEREGGELDRGEPESLEFLAAFPPISSAIRVSGNLEGMRLLLDVPESEMGNAIAIQLWRNQPLVVTVRLYDERIDGHRLAEREQSSGTKHAGKDDEAEDENSDRDPDETAAVLESYRKGKPKRAKASTAVGRAAVKQRT